MFPYIQKMFALLRSFEVSASAVPSHIYAAQAQGKGSRSCRGLGRLLLLLLLLRPLLPLLLLLLLLLLLRLLL